MHQHAYIHLQGRTYRQCVVVSESREENWMLTLQFWNSSFVPVYSELVPPGLAIEDVAADHSLAVQLLAKWLERPQSNDSQSLTMQDSRETQYRENPRLKSICHFFGSLLCMV